MWYDACREFFWQVYRTSLGRHTNRKALAIHRIKSRWASPAAGIPRYSSFDIYSPVHECRIQIISVSEEEIENFSAQGLCDLRWGFATQQWLEPSLEDGNFEEWESKPTWGDIFHCLLGSCNFPKGSHFRCSWMGWTSWVCAQGEVERAKIPILNVQSMVQDTFLLACRNPNWQVHETQAGAVADCFKHLVLVALLQSLQVWHWSRARSQRWWESGPMIGPDQYKRI